MDISYYEPIAFCGFLGNKGRTWTLVFPFFPIYSFVFSYYPYILLIFVVFGRVITLLILPAVRNRFRYADCCRALNCQRGDRCGVRFVRLRRHGLDISCETPQSIFFHTFIRSLLLSSSLLFQRNFNYMLFMYVLYRILIAINS